LQSFCLIENRLRQQPGSRLAQGSDQQIRPLLIRVGTTSRRLDAFTPEETVKIGTEGDSVQGQGFLDVPVVQ